MSRSARGARPQRTGGGRRYVSDGLPRATMYGAFFAFQADRLPMCASLFFLALNIVAGVALPVRCRFRTLRLRNGKP